METIDIKPFLLALRHDLVRKYKALSAMRDKAKDAGAKNAGDLAAACYLIRQAAGKLDAAIKNMEGDE